jgi:hypothetical protein
MSQLLRVERIGISRFGSREAVLAKIEKGLGISFGRHGEPQWHPDKRLEVNDDMRDLCALATEALCEKQADGTLRPIMDRIVTVDRGGMTPTLAREFQKVIRGKTSVEVPISTIGFEKNKNGIRPHRRIIFDSDLPKRITEDHERIFLLADVIEKGGHLVRLARSIQHDDMIDRKTGLRPTVIGIGGAVLRDRGLREYMRKKLKYSPPLHFFVHCRCRAVKVVDQQSDFEIDARYSLSPRTPLPRSA